MVKESRKIHYLRWLLGFFFIIFISFLMHFPIWFIPSIFFIFYVVAILMFIFWGILITLFAIFLTVIDKLFYGCDK